MKSKRKSINEAGYNFIEVEPGVFEFYTHYGAAYKVEFIAAGVYFDSLHPASAFIYSIDIVLLYPVPYDFYDYIISITITKIIIHFFYRDTRIIIFYICDPSDGKMKARQRKFNYWFNTYNTGEYKKIISMLKARNIDMIANFIFLRNNPSAYNIPLITDEAKDSFNNI